MERKAECACESYVGDSRLWIDYCPLHATAPELLEALRRIQSEAEAGNTGTIIGLCAEAIEKAEGRGRENSNWKLSAVGRKTYRKFFGEIPESYL